MIKKAFLFFFLLTIMHPMFGQETDLEIKDIGMLYSGNMIGKRDGGGLPCTINIVKDNSRSKKGTIKIKGQVLSVGGEPENAFYIFIGYVQNGNELVILDTLFSLPNCHPSDTVSAFLNRKKTDELFDGIFNIDLRIDDNYAVFISVIGGTLFEIKFKKSKPVANKK